MANPEHVDLLKGSIEAWNSWRTKNPEVQPDLEDADFQGCNLSRANLKGALLRRANLQDANLYQANLEEVFLGNDFSHDKVFINKISGVES